MSRRAQLILLPFLAVPLILLLVVGSIVSFGRSGAAPATEAAAAAPTAAAAAQPTDVPVVAVQEPVPTVPPEVRAPIDAEDALITALYSARSPAVVSIQILGDAGSIGPGDAPEGDGGLPDGPEGSPFEFQAQGSGFLIDDDGHIVTNNHVVENAETIEVTFQNGTTVDAETIGTDVDSDLAVIKVERVPEGVQPLELGDSDRVQVGQRAIAIGNPFGLDSTLTVGVVSARGRTIPSRVAGEGGIFSMADVLQTDAAINPGNSGGPLFNSAGEVIGVNNAIRTEGGTFEGVGFAIPSNTVAKVSASLIENGRYEHPYLGISMGQPITDAVARELDLPVNYGVPISLVVEGGPSDEAGLQGGTGEHEFRGIPYPTGGDIVLKIDDLVVHSSTDVIDYLATETEVGQTVTLTVLRDGEEQEIDVTLGARPGEE
jgi:2-alkenal reductase